MTKLPLQKRRRRRTKKFRHVREPGEGLASGILSEHIVRGLPKLDDVTDGRCFDVDYVDYSVHPWKAAVSRRVAQKLVELRKGKSD